MLVHAGLALRVPGDHGGARHPPSSQATRTTPSSRPGRRPQRQAETMRGKRMITPPQGRPASFRQPTPAANGHVQRVPLDADGLDNAPPSSLSRGIEAPLTAGFLVLGMPVGAIRSAHTPASGPAARRVVTAVGRNPDRRRSGPGRRPLPHGVRNLNGSADGELPGDVAAQTAGPPISSQ